MRHLMIFVLCLAACLGGGSVAIAQGSQGSATPVELDVKTAPVMVDDMCLFSVRGVASLPAEERARLITERVVRVAEDPKIGTASITAVESPAWTSITAGPVTIMGVVDADAALEGVRREVISNDQERGRHHPELGHRQQQRRQLQQPGEGAGAHPPHGGHHRLRHPLAVG